LKKSGGAQGQKEKNRPRGGSPSNLIGAELAKLKGLTAKIRDQLITN